MQQSRSTIGRAGGASSPRGWPLTLAASVVTATLCSFAYTLLGGGLAGWQSVVRTSAKTSLAFFLAAFVASSVRALWRTPFTAWLLANRRYIGVSFAASHTIHLLGIVAVAALSPDFSRGAATLLFGGLGYVLLFAMAATSFDGAVTRLGRRRWQRLHKTGMYYLWMLFVLSYVPRAVVESAWYWLLAAPLLAAVPLRLAVWHHQRR
jgi:DMSO/TMAO reductase YedYZ heme-binding membrane subunit